jgi:hypothetical protein
MDLLASFAPAMPTVSRARRFARAKVSKFPLIGGRWQDHSYPSISHRTRGLQHQGQHLEQFAAVFGGFNLMEFGKNGSVVINPLWVVLPFYRW